MTYAFDDKLKEVASALVANCKARREIDGLAETYASDAVSVEALEMGGDMPRLVAGIDAIRAKHEWWNSTFEVQNQEITGPFLHGEDRFSVMFSVKTRHRQSGEIDGFTEIGHYTVSEGKIVREEFFYAS
ncbi:MAG: SnoaL-like domain-containing protein [Pseudomonadota bacterium]